MSDLVKPRALHVVGAVWHSAPKNRFLGDSRDRLHPPITGIVCLLLLVRVVLINGDIHVVQPAFTVDRNDSRAARYVDAWLIHAASP